MATISNPIGLYFRYISSSAGNSWRQGPHQLAQKLIITTLPLKSASDTGLPARLASVNAGAGAVASAASAGQASATSAAASRAIGNLDILFKRPPRRTP